MLLGLFWSILGVGLALAFWGLVLSLILKSVKKLDRLPRGPILWGLLLGGMIGALMFLSY